MSQPQAPVELLVAAWPDASAAGEALAALEEAKKEHLVGIVQAATVVVDADGKLRINDTKDMGPKKGAVVGGLLGAGLGLITGGVGWLLLGGGAVGALAAKARDGGLSDARLKELGERMAPDSSAIVAVVELTWVADVEREFADVGAAVVREAVEADLVAQLSDGSAVSYSAAGAEDDVVATRTVVPGARADSGTQPAEQGAGPSREEES